MKKKWEVWIEENVTHAEFVILEMKVVFKGSKSACYKYYDKNGGSKAGLHIGYDLV